MSAASWYDVLDVEPDASADEIRAAWRAAVADLDPTDRRFRVYNQAAEVLLDPSRRAAYDAELAAELAAAAGRARARRRTPVGRPERRRGRRRPAADRRDRDGVGRRPAPRRLRASRRPGLGAGWSWRPCSPGHSSSRRVLPLARRGHRGRERHPGRPGGRRARDRAGAVLRRARTWTRAQAAAQPLHDRQSAKEYDKLFDGDRGQRPADRHGRRQRRVRRLRDRPLRRRPGRGAGLRQPATTQQAAPRGRSSTRTR